MILGADSDRAMALLERLSQSEHSAYARQVRFALSRAEPPFMVRLDRTTALVVRVVDGGRELKCLLERQGHHPVRIDRIESTSRESMLPRKRRSIRMSDELWARLSKYGDPSTVAEMLCEEGVGRLERAATAGSGAPAPTDTQR